jgi:primosomal protein N' (replication factor Y)
MAYHKTDGMLHCHYCGTNVPLPAKCPDCGSASIRSVGVGTQKVEEELRRLFPEVKTLRMDFDTTRTQNAHQEIINAFRARRAQVLIGTQMIAKGLDFPQVSLVGAILADLSLAMPDYRAAERTFQLMVQVAGRAPVTVHYKGKRVHVRP